MISTLSDFSKQPFVPADRSLPQRSRHEPRKLFLKGPVPTSWLYATFGLGSRATQMGIYLWILAGMRGSKTFRASWGELPGRFYPLDRLPRLDSAGEGTTYYRGT